MQRPIVNVGAKFWLAVMAELRNRGIQDIPVVDGLKGLPEAITQLRA